MLIENHKIHRTSLRQKSDWKNRVKIRPNRPFVKIKHNFSRDIYVAVQDLVKLGKLTLGCYICELPFEPLHHKSGNSLHTFPNHPSYHRWVYVMILSHKIHAGTTAKAKKTQSIISPQNINFSVTNTL